jgi:hypothetical protein
MQALSSKVYWPKIYSGLAVTHFVSDFRAQRVSKCPLRIKTVFCDRQIGVIKRYAASLYRISTATKYSIILTCLDAVGKKQCEKRRKTRSFQCEKERKPFTFLKLTLSISIAYETYICVLLYTYNTTGPHPLNNFRLITLG